MACSALACHDTSSLRDDGANATSSGPWHSVENGRIFFRVLRVRRFNGDRVFRPFFFCKLPTQHWFFFFFDSLINTLLNLLAPMESSPGNPSIGPGHSIHVFTGESRGLL